MQLRAALLGVMLGVLLMTLFARCATAGQMEFDRDAAKVRAEHEYVVKVQCQTLPKAQQAKCTADANAHLAEALKGLRSAHLGEKNGNWTPRNPR